MKECCLPAHSGSFLANFPIYPENTCNGLDSPTSAINQDKLTGMATHQYGGGNPLI